MTAVALPASLFNVFFAVLIAYRMRGRVAGKRLLTTILVIAVSLGTVFVADGLLTYLGPKGWFNRVLMALHLVNGEMRLVHNYWGVVFALIISGFPVRLACSCCPLCRGSTPRSTGQRRRWAQGRGSDPSRAAFRQPLPAGQPASGVVEGYLSAAAGTCQDGGS